MVMMWWEGSRCRVMGALEFVVAVEEDCHIAVSS